MHAPLEYGFRLSCDISQRGRPKRPTRVYVVTIRKAAPDEAHDCSTIAGQETASNHQCQREDEVIQDLSKAALVRATARFDAINVYQLPRITAASRSQPRVILAAILPDSQWNMGGHILLYHWGTAQLL